MSKIHKNAAGIILENRSVLMVRAIGKDFFISPGGGIEDETPEHAVCRELDEELSIKVKEKDLAFFGFYKADAAGRPGEEIHMQAFLVKGYQGALVPSSEIEEYKWFNSQNADSQPIGSIFKKYVIPELAESGLID